MSRDGGGPLKHGVSALRWRVAAEGGDFRGEVCRTTLTLRVRGLGAASWEVVSAVWMARAQFLLALAGTKGVVPPDRRGRRWMVVASAVRCVGSAETLRVRGPGAASWEVVSAVRMARAQLLLALAGTKGVVSPGRRGQVMAAPAARCARRRRPSWRAVWARRAVGRPLFGRLGPLKEGTGVRRGGFVRSCREALQGLLVFSVQEPCAAAFLGRAGEAPYAPALPTSGHGSGVRVALFSLVRCPAAPRLHTHRQAQGGLPLGAGIVSPSLANAPRSARFPLRFSSPLSLFLSRPHAGRHAAL